ncbi:MAG TPA: precorrin-2 C(20)-methyltransferase [Syntrophaceae bacterium]|nr:precorrin-2 C(20)-methyltransferase [Syntrophaceae bacterium]HCX01468.1 precorrin-2 C(20)-methyltransferase [Syntrophaceae bacterium]
MNQGILYGVGVGPGDPELITVKGARILGVCRYVFAPKAKAAVQSTALKIARPYLHDTAEIHELLFPMSPDPDELSRSWADAASRIAAVLEQGQDACFLTLGDPFLYSTYIYLLRALRARLTAVRIQTVPGITAFCAAASAAEFPVGEGKSPVTILPADDDEAGLMRALEKGGTVAVMKIGKRLPAVIDILETQGLLDHAVYISRVGMQDERLETNLRLLRHEGEETGYLSVILISARRRS